MQQHPRYIFNEDGTMRAAETNASPVKVLREETGVSAVPNMQQHILCTAVVVDAMHAVRRWSFHKDDTFGAVARRHRNMPADTRLAKSAYIAAATGTIILS